MTIKTSKNLPIYCNPNISVSTDILIIMPNIMVKYLWELALCKDWKNNENQLFILKARELSGRSVQDIYHFCDNGNLIDRCQVYGIKPVNSKLQVFNLQNIYQMLLCMGQ